MEFTESAFYFYSLGSKVLQLDSAAALILLSSVIDEFHVTFLMEINVSMDGMNTAWGLR